MGGTPHTFTSVLLPGIPARDLQPGSKGQHQLTGSSSPQALPAARVGLMAARLQCEHVVGMLHQGTWVSCCGQSRAGKALLQTPPLMSPRYSFLLPVKARKKVCCSLL